MKRLWWVRVLAAAVAVSAAVVGCGGDGGESTSTPSLPGKTNEHGTKTASGTIEVELDDFYFGPTFIKATPGQQITLELKNDGSTEHTFTSPDLGGVDELLSPGATKRVTVTAPQTGFATFSCKFHVAQGMQGAVFVA